MCACYLRDSCLRCSWVPLKLSEVSSSSSKSQCRVATRLGDYSSKSIFNRTLLPAAMPFGGFLEPWCSMSQERRYLSKTLPTINFLLCVYTWLHQLGQGEDSEFKYFWEILAAPWFQTPVTKGLITALQEASHSSEPSFGLIVREESVLSSFELEVFKQVPLSLSD